MKGMTEMKYIVVLYDGMADYPVPALDGKTPMMCAKKPLFDSLAKQSEVGLVKTVHDMRVPHRHSPSDSEHLGW